MAYFTRLKPLSLRRGMAGMALVEIIVAMSLLALVIVVRRWHEIAPEDEQPYN